jgi:NADP-dependent 3-hydroxy acid dehydrogenase YdfG
VDIESMNPFKDRVAAITGARQGSGKASAPAFPTDGASVAVIGRIVSFIASLPAKANLLQTTMLPIQRHSFVGRA